MQKAQVVWTTWACINGGEGGIRYRTSATNEKSLKIKNLRFANQSSKSSIWTFATDVRMDVQVQLYSLLVFHATCTGPSSSAMWRMKLSSD